MGEELKRGRKDTVLEEAGHNFKSGGWWGGRHTIFGRKI